MNNILQDYEKLRLKNKQLMKSLRERDLMIGMNNDNKENIK